MRSSVPKIMPADVIAGRRSQHNLLALGVTSPLYVMAMASNTRARWSRCFAPLLVALAWATPARAQGDAAQQAESLFREGREAVDRGDYTTGCSKFAASLRLTQRASPLLNLANCEEHQGRLVSALAHWTEGIALLPKGDERIEVSRQRAEALGRRIPRLTVALAASPPTGTKVTLDGATVSPAALGVPQPIDLGEHILITGAPGYADAKSTLVLKEGERREVTVTPGLPVPSAPAIVAPPPVVEKPLPLDPPPSGNGQRTAGFVIGGVGVASLVVGAITGALTIGKKGDLEKLCPSTQPLCDPGQKEAILSVESSGKTLSTLSTITFLVGGAGLAAGVVLVLTSGPKRSPTTATLSPLALPGGGGLLMGGSF